MEQTVPQTAQTVEKSSEWLKNDWKLIKKVTFGHLDN
jgi:hypothetical protein